MEAIKDRVLESSMRAGTNNYKEFAQDLKWYFKEKHYVIPKALDDLKVTVRYDGECNILEINMEVDVPNKPQFYEFNCDYTLSEFIDIRKDVVKYKECLDEFYYLYNDYYQASYEAERKAEIKEKSERFAQAVMTMLNTNKEPQVPTFCSCCGARLNVETHNCDYCGATWVRPE